MAGAKKQAAGPTPVEATRHKDKRLNNPTSQLSDFVDETEKALPLLYPRDPSIDPQLVWQGKDQLDISDLEVAVRPIYIQEKIDPRAIVEKLRDTAPPGEAEPEMTLFQDFDAVEGFDTLEFYEHENNWSNRLILGDALEVMASLAEKESLRGKVQMVYMDPPYGVKFGSNWQVSTAKREVKDGKDVTREPEVVKAFRDTWQDGIHTYLGYLRDRMAVAHDLLTESGSIFVQISDTNMHLVRSVLDEVFGAANFVSQIAFQTTSGFATRTISTLGDYLLWYAKDADQLKVRKLYEPQSLVLGSGNARWALLPDGTYRGVTKAEQRGEAVLPEGARLYFPGDMQAQGAASEPQPFEFEGKTYSPLTNSHWKASYPDGLDRLAVAKRIHVAKNSLRYRRSHTDFPYQQRGNIWTDTITGNFTEDKVYVVQTSTKVVERCLLLCTDPGDLVFDPTCGSGTTALMAERHGRRWITTDTSRVAVAIARSRLMSTLHPYYYLLDSQEGAAQEAALSGGDEALTGPFSQDVRKGFVYRRAGRITLASIARNEAIVDGLSDEEIERLTQQAAEQTYFWDQPLEDPTKVRVSGRFTVESLSPHTALDASSEDAASTAASNGSAEAGFEKTVLENLQTSGVKNSFKGEALVFTSLDPHPGQWIQATGEYEDAEGTSRRVAVSIGPRQGTVSSLQVKEAAKEAAKGIGYDVLLVLGFAFDAQMGEKAKAIEGEFATAGSERKVGGMRILPVRMNLDLTMGDGVLKKTKNANLFNVFGEPDLDISTTPDGVVVTLNGLDVYDPQKNELRPASTDEIACWFIDTEYDGESFFVRHAYFTGADSKKQFQRLADALKADINEEAWSSLYRTTSLPFAKPSTNKIAVKVINHHGDEVLQIYDV